MGGRGGIARGDTKLYINKIYNRFKKPLSALERECSRKMKGGIDLMR